LENTSKKETATDEASKNKHLVQARIMLYLLQKKYILKTLFRNTELDNERLQFILDARTSAISTVSFESIRAIFIRHSLTKYKQILAESDKHSGIFRKLANEGVRTTEFSRIMRVLSKVADVHCPRTEQWEHRESLIVPWHRKNNSTNDAAKIQISTYY